jgi:DNA end-binding protein Ku
VHFALRQKTRLALLRVRDEVLMVQTLLWPDEVRKADFPALDTKVTVKAPELKMAMNLVDSFAGDFTPADYGDEYRDQLQQLIDAKLTGGEAFETPEPDSGDDAEVVDLLAALKRSVEQHKSPPETGSDKAGASKTGSPKTPRAKSAKPASKKAPDRKPATRRRKSA